MRPACVCPSIFEFPHAGNSPSVSGIIAFLQQWFAAINKHHFSITFSPNYVKYLKDNWLPTLKSEDVNAFKRAECWTLMTYAANRYAQPIKQKFKSVCCCKLANHFWTQLITELQEESPVIVSDNCSTRPTEFDTVCSENELMRCPPEIWLKSFKDFEWQTLPLAGDVFYEPPKKLETNRYSTKNDQRCNWLSGYKRKALVL